MILLLLYLSPFFSAAGGWIGIGLLHDLTSHRLLVRSRWYGLLLLMGIYALGFYILGAKSRGYFPFNPFGDVIFLFSGVGIILRTLIQHWTQRQYRAARAYSSLLISILLPVGLKASIEYPYIRAQDCLTTAALTFTAQNLEAWKLAHHTYPDDLYGSLEIYQTFQARQCDDAVQATNKYVSVHRYDQPYWLYQRTPTGYDLGYFSRELYFLDWSLANRVCLYNANSATTDCSYNQWGPFTGIKIVWESKHKSS